MGYNSDQRGLAIKTVGLFCTLTGTFLGGFCTTIFGLGHCLWIFGALQVFANVGYVLLSRVGVHLPIFYSAIGFEIFVQGLATGAFSVFLLRLTEKRFSATQYALFTSMFAVNRVLSGVISGFAADAMGWTNFYLLSIVAGIPGLLFLHRFSPLGSREPKIESVALPQQRHISRRRSIFYVGCASLIAFLSSSLMMIVLDFIKKNRLQGATTWGTECMGFFFPTDILGWLQILGILVFTVSMGLCTAAYQVAKKKV